MVSQEQWAVLDTFRETIEREYVDNVLGKPERLPAYEETITTLRESLERYGINRADPEQVYPLLAGMISALSFISAYFNTVCNDRHMMSHLAESGIFLGYLIRELCYESEAPSIGVAQ